MRRLFSINKALPHSVQSTKRRPWTRCFISFYYHGGRVKRKFVKRSLIEQSLHKRLNIVKRLSCSF